MIALVESKSDTPADYVHPSGDVCRSHPETLSQRQTAGAFLSSLNAAACSVLQLHAAPTCRQSSSAKRPHTWNEFCFVMQFHFSYFCWHITSSLQLTGSFWWQFGCRSVKQTFSINWNNHWHKTCLFQNGRKLKEFPLQSDYCNSNELFLL